MPPTKVTVETFLVDKWLPQVRVRPSTKASYRQIVRTHIVPRIGARRLDDLDAADLNRLYGDLASFGRKDGSGLSDKTVRNVHIVIRKALGDALRWGQLTRNVATLADPPKQPSLDQSR